MTLTKLLQSPFLLRWEFPVALVANIGWALLFLFMVEKLAVRTSGYAVARWARWVMTLPPLLLLAANYWIHFLSYYEFDDITGPEVLFWAAAFTVFCLPGVVSAGEGQRTTFGSGLGVWGAGVVYAVGFFFGWRWVYTCLAGRD